MRPTDVLDRVLALSVLVTADMERFEHQHRLSRARVHLVWLLGASGPCTQRALADGLGVTPRNITGLVDGLVESGHVTRERHPTDRRATLVTLTALGATLLDELRTGHAELAAALFADLPEDRRAAFGRELDETLARFGRLVEGAP